MDDRYENENENVNLNEDENVSLNESTDDGESIHEDEQLQGETDSVDAAEYSFTGEELNERTAGDFRQDENATRFYYVNPDVQPGQNPFAKKKKWTGLAIACTAVILAVICATVGVCSMIFRSETDSGPDGGLPVDVVTGSVDGQGGGDSVQLSYSDSGESYPITEIVKNVADAVVEIRTEKVVTGSWIGQYVAEGAGSGVIISADGFIATNNHVIEGAEKITVLLRDGTEYTATLWGTNAKNDLAVVKVEATGLKMATFGNSDALSVGELAVAIGNPLGSLGGTVTSGIISALARQINVDGKTMTLIQTDAPVNPGNSGGGLFNAAGELIGIVNAKSSGDNIEGIGFAIPSSTALPLIQDIIQNKSSSQKAYLGVTVNYSSRYGVVYIASIENDSDAERAGLKVDDIVISINGTQITSASQMSSLIAASYVGDTAEFVIYRNGKSTVINVEYTQPRPENS